VTARSTVPETLNVLQSIVVATPWNTTSPPAGEVTFRNAAGLSEACAVPP